MNTVKSLILLFALVLTLAACGNADNAENTTTDETTTATPHGEGKAYTSAYVCPMHCEGSGSDEAGDCPVCGMSYVASEDHTKDGHTH